RQYLDRLSEHLQQPRLRAAATRLQQRFDESRTSRQRMLDRLKLDANHRRLFEVYPEIGSAKLYRRLAQLRNFYYLDLLLAEIADRLGVVEWVVRCMLPEELETILAERRPIPPTIHERQTGCLFALVDGRETIIGGDEALQLFGRFQE